MRNHVAPVTKPKVNLQKTFLRYWRRNAKLSQEEAAEKMQVSRGLLSQLENAKTPYSQRLLEQAAIIYDCTPAELIAGPNCLNIEVLKKSIESVEEICLRMRIQAGPAEKADMILKFYRDSLSVIRH
jgi:transcriptional regulator with XRE-family HTH domain